eukprot:CAMPEP_0197718266 /NCGR_PEP_ID=MMETSP1434-20131217/2488_1 /TAXON_ID=265543 /ORGANISM="Minutocellus polymorphus, Strain CCMP3303" /LENGTH=534 /DNA_ID=CAMNT_0043302897 /DNA_START=97 /DNA_END=1701 /DNA_ORIENTATION=+
MTPLEILDQTPWFADVSAELAEALASKMVLREVEAGHIFTHEGMPVTNLLIIEEGTLVRSKAESSEVAKSISANASAMDVNFSSPEAFEKSIVVDAIQGAGRVTGLLHILVEVDTLAFATVWAKTPAKVWQIASEDIREIFETNAKFALEMMNVLAMSMRVGSKSLRGLIKNVSGSSGAADGEEGAKPTIKVLCYDSTSWTIDSFKPAVKAFNDSSDSAFEIKMDFTADRLSERSATYAAGYDAICLFVNDNADAECLRILSLLSVKMIVMRCAGFDRVDIHAAKAYGFTVARVPAYSPYAVAEHAIALLMSVNRRIHTANVRTKMANFTLDTGLLGMDIHGKTVGVMGTGKIGQILCRILNGFGANLLAYDVFESDAVKELGGVYVSKEEIFEKSDVIFLMMPLLPQTKHTINMDVLGKLKRGVLIVNTARGGLVDTKALISGLQTGAIGGAGIDVFENEADYFFQDWSAKNITDPELTALLGNNKVVLTAHQAFFTKEAIDKIVGTTLDNLCEWKAGKKGTEHPNTCIFPSK